MIRAFINNLFSNNVQEIKSENISITSDSDFILLILAVIRQNEGGMAYSIDLNTHNQVERNGYIIPDMTVRRKESKKSVE